MLKNKKLLSNGFSQAVVLYLNWCYPGATISLGEAVGGIMIATTHSYTLAGIAAKPILIECDMTNGLPSMTIVGISASTAEGIKERVRSAIKNSGLEFPRKRITINLAPAGEAINSPHYDLPIAISILVRSGQLPSDSFGKVSLVGELGLDGTVRSVRGIFSMAQTSMKQKHLIILPAGNAEQVSLIRGCSALSCTSLLRLCELASSRTKLESDISPKRALVDQPTPEKVDFGDIVGQNYAKRAMEIAAAGGHNILLTGPPGTGKSMLAKALPSILPPMTSEEIITTSQIHSLVGDSFGRIVTERPFRAPHHSASHIALIGGGQDVRPGEISLSHNGVLLLDEAPEFTKPTLESLRQPMEDGSIQIGRASRAVIYPANFMLVATMNPCPCGFYGDLKRTCRCAIKEVISYQKKLSGPILDRIDLHVALERLDSSLIASRQHGGPERSAQVRGRVVMAVRRQELRGKGLRNADLSSVYVRQQMKLSPEAKEILLKAIDRLQLSPRAYFRVAKVAQTIADLAKSDQVRTNHVAEALQYRVIESRFSSLTSLTPET